jgi:hypothetical protein
MHVRQALYHWAIPPGVEDSIEINFLYIQISHWDCQVIPNEAQGVWWRNLIYIDDILIPRMMMMCTLTSSFPWFSFP